MLTPLEWGLLFLAGVGGSAHCLGMCGVFAIGAGRGGPRPLGYLLPYTAGRLTSYFSLGLLVGLLGRPLQLLAPLAGAPAVLALTFGAVMVLGGLHLLGLIQLPLPRFGARSGNLLAQILRATLPPAGPAQALYLGVGNGLLPCPLIYGFLPLAMSTGSSPGGGLVMAMIGLGTVPALFGIATLGRVWPSAPWTGQRWAWLRWAPGLALLALGLLRAGRAALLWTATGHAGHVPM